MVCRSCGAPVGDSDRFCNACGARLQAEPAVSDDESDAGQAPGDTSADSAGGGAEEGDRLPPPTIDSISADPPVSTDADDGDDPDRTSEMRAPSLYDLADEADPDVTSELAAMAGGRTVTAPSSTGAEPGERTTIVATSGVGATTTMRSTGPATTGQVPASYTPYEPGGRSFQPSDGEDGGPHRFRFRMMLLLAVLAAAAGAASAVTDVIDITTDATQPLFPVGTWMINDFGTNSTVAMAIAVAAMVSGALLGCFGFRWGGGLAGGAGLALAGWSALMIGLAEIPLAQAESGIQAQSGSFRATLTRDWGYWFIVAAGALGVVTLLASLGSVRRDRATNLNPWVAALGAAASLVAAAGPLVPVNGASIGNNWSSGDSPFDVAGIGPIDLPTTFFVGRLVQVGLVALTGLAGFLLVRRYGLGLAAGGLTVFAWLAITALLEQTDFPIGPAVANPGATDTIPHAVTIAGGAVAIFCLLMAAIEVALTRRE
jgi:hypothetical protein